MLTGMKSVSSSFADTAASKVTPQPVTSAVTSTHVCRSIQRKDVCVCVCVLHLPLCNKCLCVIVLPEKCARVHWHLPYKWQILDSDGVTWKDLPNMEEVEKAYCDPQYDTSCKDQTSSTLFSFTFLSFQRCSNRKGGHGGVHIDLCLQQQII